MASPREQELYFQARDRALTRFVEGNKFKEECETGFSWGIAASEEGGIHPDSEAEIINRIKSESNFAFGFVCGLMAKMESMKGRSYASSWQKRGEAGILPNLQRKFDRLDSLMENPNSAGDTLSQTVGDLGVYGFKWLVLRAEINPAEFMSLIKEIRLLKGKEPESGERSSHEVPDGSSASSEPSQDNEKSG
jgi:hypothetical protein